MVVVENIDWLTTSSGVARVLCALGQETFLRPRQQKLQR